MTGRSSLLNLLAYGSVWTTCTGPLTTLGDDHVDDTPIALRTASVYVGHVTLQGWLLLEV
jgi:hypothetical protein